MTICDLIGAYVPTKIEMSSGELPIFICKALQIFAVWHLNSAYKHSKKKFPLNSLIYSFTFPPLLTAHNILPYLQVCPDGSTKPSSRMAVAHSSSETHTLRKWTE